VVNPSIHPDDWITARVGKNPIAEIYCNAEKLTLYGHEKGELILEGRYGEIGKNEDHLSIQNVAKDLQSKVGNGRTIDQVIEDIRQRKMYIEMEHEARMLLLNEFQSIKQEIKSQGILREEDPQILDFRKGGCARFRTVYNKTEDIEGLPYPEAACWAYITGIGVYFGLKENRDVMRRNAIAELRVLCWIALPLQ
jgi:hypothetical protein